MSIPASLLLLPPPVSPLEQIKEELGITEPLEPRGKDRPAAEEFLVQADSQKKSSSQEGKKIGQATLPCGAKADEPSAASNPQVEKKQLVEPCALQSLVIKKASDPTRGYEVKVDKEILVQSNYLEVIPDKNSTHTSIDCTLDGVEGPCTQNKAHLGKVIDVSYHCEVKSDSKLVFKAYPRSIPFAKKVFLYPLGLPVNVFEVATGKATEYRIPAHTCNGMVEGIVRVFPRVELQNLGVSTSFDFNIKRKSNHSEDESPFDRHIDAKTKIGGKLVINDKEYSVEKDFPSVKQSLEKAFNLVNMAKSRLQKLSKGASGFEANLDPIAISLSVSYAFKEVKGQPDCDHEYDVTLALAPLLGGSLKWDLAGRVLSSVPYIGLLLTLYKYSIEQTKKGELFIGFRLEGALNASCKIVKEAGQSAFSSEKEITTTIDLKAEIRTNLKFEELVVFQGGEITVGAKSGFGLVVTPNVPSVTGKLSVNVSLTWNGLVFYAEAKTYKGTMVQKQETLLRPPESDYETSTASSRQKSLRVMDTYQFETWTIFLS